jgi:RNA polymerase sigma-70 factor, ECF subfamily
LLVVLETLSPLERAVFVLREAFGLPYAEVAEILGRAESAVRQVARRAREHVDARRPRFATDSGMQRRVTRRFLDACTTGDLNQLMGVLAPGVRLVSDSGGKSRAPRMPLEGADKVAHFFSVISQTGLAGAEVRLVDVNGGVGLATVQDGQITGLAILDVVDEHIAAIHMLVNPDKLRGLALP